MSLIEKIVQRTQKKFPIRSNSVKGIIQIAFKDRPTLYLLDIKTPGYPLKSLVNHLVVRGGNWEDIEDKCPIDTYAREMREEFQVVRSNPKEKDPNKFVYDPIELENVEWVYNSLINSAEPLWDILFIAEEEAYKQIGKGPITGLQSYFLSTIDGDEFCRRFQIKGKEDHEVIGMMLYHLNLRSVESRCILLSEEDFRRGINTPFVLGDDQTMKKFFREKRGLEACIQEVKGIEMEEVSRDPNKPYKDKELLKYLELNPCRTGNTQDSFYEVYEK